MSCAPGESYRLDVFDDSVKCCGSEDMNSAWRDVLVDLDVPDDCEDESVWAHCVDDT